MAFEAQERGAWQKALDLYLEARGEPECAAAVELNIQICQYHLGHDEGLADRALALGSTLRPLGNICCWGIAMLSAHRAGDFEKAKLVACLLSRAIEKPWDLPTVPSGVTTYDNDVMVRESASVEVVAAIVEELRTGHTNSTEEERLLSVLAQRYRERIRP